MFDVYVCLYVRVVMRRYVRPSVSRIDMAIRMDRPVRRLLVCASVRRHARAHADASDRYAQCATAPDAQDVRALVMRAQLRLRARASCHDAGEGYAPRACVAVRLRVAEFRAHARARARTVRIDEFARHAGTSRMQVVARARAVCAMFGVAALRISPTGFARRACAEIDARLVRGVCARDSGYGCRYAYAAVCDVCACGQLVSMRGCCARMRTRADTGGCALRVTDATRAHARARMRMRADMQTLSRWRRYMRVPRISVCRDMDVCA